MPFVAAICKGVYFKSWLIGFGVLAILGCIEENGRHND